MNDEIQYYKKRLDELAGDNIRLDYKISLLSHELRQKRQGLTLLSELIQTLGHKKTDSIHFCQYHCRC